jgi:DUF4097 and DUF4098 domain-containing protein YvlB
MRTSLVLQAAVAAVLLLPSALPAQRRDPDREREREAARREREERRARAERCDPDDDSCDEDDDRRDRRARLDTTVRLSGRAEVNLSLVDGRITVRGWDRSEAHVRAESESGDIRFESSGSRLELRQERRARHSDDARYDVSVPYGTRVVMRSTSGDLSATEVRGEVEAHTTSGNLRIEGASGRTLFESISGDVEGRRLTGPVRGQAISGSVSLEQITGDVEVETVSGEIAVNQARGSFVRLETTSGDLDFSGPFDRSGRYEFNSHSGSITLGLPSDVGARVSVETFSGELDTAFPLTLTPTTGDGRPRHFEFTLGGGGARVTAQSFSGDINLRRSGASTSPRE